MKTYRVELTTTVDVEAENEEVAMEEAMALAFNKAAGFFADFNAYAEEVVGDD